MGRQQHMHDMKVGLWAVAALLICVLWTASLVHFAGLAGSVGIVAAVALFGRLAGTRARPGAGSRYFH